MSTGSIVSLAAGKISDLLLQEAKLLYGVKKQIRSLQRELTPMNAFLVDMEARDEEGGDELSRTTITEIRKLVYDAEDVIESYIFEANFPLDKMEAFVKRYVCLCPSLLHTHQVGSEIEAIKARIAETLDNWKKYVGPSGGIRTDVGAGRNRLSRRRRIAYPHIKEEHVVGLEEDINNLVGWLTSSDTEIKVLSIVGMGGSGKTTLARKVYNHDSVKGHFNCIAWLSISQVWDAQQILVELLRQVGGKTNETCSLQLLVDNLHQYLEGKRYLIVLDDVWTNQALEEIFPALPDDGRRIIITTRKGEVVDFPDLERSIHEPKRLTEEESWELFRKIALIHREQTNNSLEISVDLETLGREMLEKCEGLPLAVIALAGILSKKETLEEWERVKMAVSSRIMAEGRGTQSYGPVNEMLTLSYNDLRNELKPCFLYLGMFREDAEIPIGRLIRMWIAEGFIGSNMLQNGEKLEDVARDYLEELIDRCMVQIEKKNYRGEVKSIRVHDLVRDLCIKKAKQQDFLEIFTCQSSNSNAIGTELRRTALYSEVMKNILPLPTHCPHLRSLHYQVADYWNRTDQELSLKPIHQNFKLLRVLSLEYIDTSDGTLPTGIGSLFHLRYLRLRWTNIHRLPDSIGNLRNLQYLEWMNYAGDKKVLLLPTVLWKIESLRHLSIPDNREMKGGVWKLHTLKRLHTIKGMTGGPWMLEELPRLSPTVQKLRIHGISSEEQLEALFRCPSIKSGALHSLDLDWDTITEQGKVVMLESENLQSISKCQHLRKLRLCGRITDRLSSFNQFPTSIMKLRLESTGIEEETALATLGKLPNLMYLVLHRGSYVGTNWTVMEVQFTQLKELHLEVLPNLEDWRIEAGSMLKLRKLVIHKCKELRRLPEGLQFITTLQDLHLVQMSQMTDAFKDRVKEKGEDVNIIQHVPGVNLVY